MGVVNFLETMKDRYSINSLFVNICIGLMETIAEISSMCILITAQYLKKYGRSTEEITALKKAVKISPKDEQALVALASAFRLAHYLCTHSCVLATLN